MKRTSLSEEDDNTTTVAATAANNASPAAATHGKRIRLQLMTPQRTTKKTTSFMVSDLLTDTGANGTAEKAPQLLLDPPGSQNDTTKPQNFTAQSWHFQNFPTAPAAAYALITAAAQQRNQSATIAPTQFTNNNNTENNIIFTQQLQQQQNMIRDQLFGIYLLNECAKIMSGSPTQPPLQRPDFSAAAILSQNQTIPSTATTNNNNNHPIFVNQESLKCIKPDPDAVRKRRGGGANQFTESIPINQKKRKIEVPPKSDTSGESVDPIIIDCSGTKKMFGCRQCSKVYTTLGALKMHIRTHTLPCKCHICEKAFSRPWLLQGHLRTHTGEKPFKCSVCDRAFADRSNLRAHMQTHSDTKKYGCHLCSKTFSRMSLLTKHRDACQAVKHEHHHHHHHHHTNY